MYLDQNNNLQNLAEGDSGRNVARLIYPQTPNIDWQPNSCGVPKIQIPAIRSSAEAIYGQRIGEQMPVGEACLRCKNGLAPFKTCRVAMNAAGEPIAEGACMGCVLSLEQHLCTFGYYNRPAW